MPSGLKIFLWSLFWGLGGATAAFKLIMYFGMRWAGDDEMRAVTVAIASVVGGLAIGAASAVTAGVTIGKRTR